MQSLVKGILVEKTTVKFDPNIFDCLVPKLTKTEKDALLKEVAYIIAHQDMNSAAVYITRIFRDNFLFEKGVQKKQNPYPLKILITYSSSPVLDIQEILIHNRSFNYKIEESAYHSLNDIPNIFNTVKKLYYAKEETAKDKKDNETKRIEAVKNIISNAVYTAEFPPLSPLPEKPLLPNSITDDSVKENARVLENRFALAEGTIENTIAGANLKRQMFDRELEEIRNQFESAVENNLDEIGIIANNPEVEIDATQSEDLNLGRSLSKTSLEKLKDYSIFLRDSISKQYSQQKISLLEQLYDRSSDFLKICESLEKTADKVKTILKEFNYGHTIAALTHIRRSLIWCLYNAAVIYLKENWKLAIKTYPHDTGKMIEFRKNKTDSINEKFKPIISADKFCGLSFLDEEIYTNFERMPLQELGRFVHDLLIVCDKRFGSNSSSLNSVVKSLREMNEYLKTELKFTPFMVPNTYLDKTGFYFNPLVYSFESEIHERLPVLQQRLCTFNMVIKTKLSAKDMLPAALQNELENVKLESANGIKKINIFKKILLKEQVLVNILQQSKENVAAFDINKQRIDRLISILDLTADSCIEINGIKIKINHIIDQVAKENKQLIKEELQRKILFIQKQAEELSQEINKNKIDLEAKKQSFNSLSLSISLGLVIDNTNANEAGEIAEQALVLQKKIAMNKAQLDQLLPELNNTEALCKILFKCEQFTHAAKNYTQQVMLEKNRILNTKKIYAINKFYTEMLDDLNQEKLSLTDATLPILNNSLNNKIEMTTKQIKELQIQHNTLIFCHIVVNDLLDFKKWKSILNSQKILKDQETIKINSAVVDLLRIALEDIRFKGWLTNAKKAADLLIALKEYAINNKTPQLEILQESGLTPNKLNSLLMKMSPHQGENVFLLSQEDLNAIKLPPREEKIDEKNKKQPNEIKIVQSPSLMELEEPLSVLDPKIVSQNKKDIKTQEPPANAESRKKEPKKFTIKNDSHFTSLPWGKIILGTAIGISFVAATFFTAGLLPSIVSGSAWGISLFTGSLLLGGTLGGLTGRAAGKIKTKPGGAKGFFKRHWGKILTGTLVTGFILGGILTGGVLTAAGVISGISFLSATTIITTALGLGVAASLSSLGVTVSAVAAAGIGSAIVTAGTMLATGTTIGFVAAGIESKACKNKTDERKPSEQGNSDSLDPATELEPNFSPTADVDLEKIDAQSILESVPIDIPTNAQRLPQKISESPLLSFNGSSIQLIQHLGTPVDEENEQLVPKEELNELMRDINQLAQQPKPATDFEKTIGDEIMLHPEPRVTRFPGTLYNGGSDAIEPTSPTPSQPSPTSGGLSA